MRRIEVLKRQIHNETKHLRWLQGGLERRLRDHGLSCESFEPAKGANPQTADS